MTERTHSQIYDAAAGVYHSYKLGGPRPQQSLCGAATALSSETKTPGAPHCLVCLDAEPAPADDWRRRHAKEHARG